MKKAAIFSLLVNIVLLVSGIILFNLYSDVKNSLNTLKKSIVVKGETKVLDSVKDNNNPIYIFKSRRFPCDSGYTSYETNICIGEKLHFADSLLNVLVVSNLKEFDDEINRDKDGVLKAKDNSLFVNSLKINIASKENFIKAQQKWEEMRALNAEYVRLGCEGGTGCSGIVSSSELKDVLRRMQEIKERYN